MKNIILIIVFLVCCNITYSQTNTVNILSRYSVIDAPTGTYIKDIFDTFTPFLGTWKYQKRE